MSAFAARRALYHRCGAAVKPCPAPAGLGSGMLRAGSVETMSECKHGLKNGCAYCHGSATAAPRPPGPKRPTKASRLSEKMNDRMTALTRRLRKLRGDPGKD